MACLQAAAPLPLQTVARSVWSAKAVLVLELAFHERSTSTGERLDQQPMIVHTRAATVAFARGR